MFHLGVDRSQIEWKLKVKTQISVFPWAKIGQNDHTNPYIESTTVLSDIPTCCADDLIQTFVVQDKINEPQLPYISCKQQTALMYVKKNHPLYTCFDQDQASSAVTGREHIAHVHVAHFF